MPRLCSSLLLSLLIAGAASADSIEFSNPYYFAANAILSSPIGDPYAYYEVDDSDSNAIGDLAISSDTGYATAYGAADTFHLRASSSVDSSQMAARGWDNLVGDGAARFETDFVIISDQPHVSVDVAYAFTEDFIGDGTYGGQLQLLLLQWVPGSRGHYHWKGIPPDDTTDAEQYVLENYSLTPGELYQLAHGDQCDHFEHWLLGRCHRIGSVALAPFHPRARHRPARDRGPPRTRDTDASSPLATHSNRRSYAVDRDKGSLRCGAHRGISPLLRTRPRSRSAPTRPPISSARRSR